GLARMNPTNGTNKTQESRITNVYVEIRPQSNSRHNPNVWNLKPGCCAIRRWRRNGLRYPLKSYILSQPQLWLKGRYHRWGRSWRSRWCRAALLEGQQSSQ